MRLLPLKEVEDIGKKQKLLTNEENLILKGENDRLSGELAKLKIAFKTDRQKLEEDFDGFCRDIQSQKETKKKELSELEDKKRELEESLDMRILKAKEQAITQKEVLLIEEENKIKEKKESLITLEKSLEGEKSQLEMSLELVDHSLREIELEKQKIKQEHENLKIQEEAFISRVTSFESKAERMEITFNERDEKCSIQEKLNEQVAKQNDEKKQELLKLQGHIESQQTTLKQAFDLARKKGII